MRDEVFMSRLRYGLRSIFTSGRGWSILAGSSLATFGVLGGAMQVYDILTPSATYHPLVMVAVLGLAPIAVGMSRAWPKRTLSRHFGQPDTTLTITVGDLFDQNTHLVVGYTDTFDTDTSDTRIIHPRSVQSQFQRRFQPDTAALDQALATALSGTSPSPDSDKTIGKNARYPIGTVAVLDAGEHRAFCTAYATMGNDLVARATVDDIWNSLGKLWDAVHVHASREPVSIAVIGSELAKVDALDRSSIIRLIALSFIARSRTTVVTRHLTIVIHPNDVDKVDMLELAAFITSI
ncbi:MULTISPECIES: macro domain-containing protein [unclassified Saccharothrix]|uniref:macro domain-containing protein n=1 Tax=unclassified Saccharothrix TaxID=2593673 RepID=UPI00307D7A80